MTPQEQAWAHLVSDHPWVAKDEYYKKHPEKSMTYRAWLAGHSSRDTEVRDLEAKLAVAVEALEKVADPRKRDHKEPDAYTQLGCVMHIASEALSRIRGKGTQDCQEGTKDEP